MQHLRDCHARKFMDDYLKRLSLSFHALLFSRQSAHGLTGTVHQQQVFTLEQMDKMVRYIVTRGDTNGDNKIGLEEALKALQTASGIGEPTAQHTETEKEKPNQSLKRILWGSAVATPHKTA